MAPIPFPTRVVVLAGALLGALSGAGPAAAATFTVNRTVDAVDARPGDGVCETAPGNRICTLRAAIQEANARSGADTINLPAGTFTVTLQNGLFEDRAADGDLDITDSLTLVGAGSGRTVVTAATVPLDRAERILHVLGAITVDIRGVTVRGGATRLVTDDGAGIKNVEATLSVSRSVITGGLTESQGGGISNVRGVVTVRDSLITRNFSEIAGGGGIANREGTVIVVDSTISDNTTDEAAGAGIFNVLGTVMVVNSTIANNGAQDDAGAIYNDRGVVVVTNTTFSGNRTGSRDGSNILNIDGTITLTNVTIARNGRRSSAVPTRGGGLLNRSGTITLHNSILAENEANTGPNCFGTITSLGYNIVGDLGGCTFRRGPNDSVGDPDLGDFVASTTPGGGHFPLQPGSPAIDRGLSPTCGAVDQLNEPRRDGNATGGTQCDRGAVEFQP